jgi:DNA phosphorothioation-dependent restriction protein DptH
LSIDKALVQNVFRLSDERHDAGTIARKLDLSRLQVAAILAHRRMQVPPPDLPIELSPLRDLWMEGTPSAVASPTHIPVVEAEEDQLSGIFVGDQVDYNEVMVMWDPANARSVQNPHLMIIGESGSGKTYAQQCLVAELAHAGIPSIIFDYGQSFERDKLEPTFVKFCDPQEYLIGEEGLSLNPLEIFSRDVKGPNTVATRLADVFDAAFRLGDIQKKVLIDAILQAYREAGITVEDMPSWRNPPPTISELREAIDALASDRQYLQNKNAAGLAARLTSFFMLVSFRTDTKAWSWDKLVETDNTRVHVLQFRGLEGKTQRVLVEVLLWHFFFHFKTHGQQALRLFCVLDEAHHLSFRENGPLSALLREARKFGLGIIFASQHPEDFNPVAYGNTASKLIFQTTDPSLKVSKFLTAKSLNYKQPDEVRDIISRLPQGNAFFISQNRGHVIHVTDFAKRSTLWGQR